MILTVITTIGQEAAVVEHMVVDVLVEMVELVAEAVVAQPAGLKVLAEEVQLMMVQMPAVDLLLVLVWVGLEVLILVVEVVLVLLI